MVDTRPIYLLVDHVDYELRYSCCTSDGVRLSLVDKSLMVTRRPIPKIIAYTRCENRRKIDWGVPGRLIGAKDRRSGLDRRGTG